MAKKAHSKPRADKAARGQQQLLYILAGLIAAMTGFSVVAIIILVTSAPPSQEESAAKTGTAVETGTGGMSKLVRVTPPRPPGNIAFEDGDGKPRTLAEWAGKVVLVNLWATWCAPCKEEMPGLGRLQAKLGGPDFAVVAISLDRGSASEPRKFLDSTAPELALYLDKTGELMKSFRAPGLPLSVLIDREGREIARLAGAAPWDEAEAEAVIRAAIAAREDT